VMNAAVDLGPLNRFPSGAITIVTARGREIGVVRLDSRIYALRNICPHQSGPLCRGKLAYQLGSAEPGSMRFEADRLVVTCPWHGWEFDVETGKALYDHSMRVATYPIEVIDHRVIIRMEREGGAKTSSANRPNQDE
jgi:nitrite reductase/ring-hydroxylating ferredoxin subunit